MICVQNVTNIIAVGKYVLGYVVKEYNKYIHLIIYKIILFLT